MAKRSELEILNEYFEGINHMKGACSQMIHQHQNIKWDAMRCMLDKITDAQEKALKREGEKIL